MMPRFKITLAYDGTGFVGWQRQAQGVSIQGLLEEALSDLDGRPVVVVGAGRTDAGVHALGQVASFSLARPIDPAALVGAINARLPAAVRVLSAEAVPESFHARFDAARKAYRYRIWNGGVPDPFERAFAWHVSVPLAVDRMEAAAARLVGRHDFAAFQATGAPTASTVREIYVSAVRRSELCRDERGLYAGRAAGSLVIYDIVGSGFLRHMVRTIVGSLVEIGRGRRSIDWIAELLERRDRTLAGPTAPPHGLVLVGVEYGLQSALGTTP